MCNNRHLSHIINRFTSCTKRNHDDVDEEIVIIKNKIKKLYEDWIKEQAKIIFKEKINEFSKVVES